EKALGLSFTACVPLHRHSLPRSRQKGSKIIRFSFPNCNHRTLPKSYGRFFTFSARSDYCPHLMEGWQYKAAFVIQFRPETDIGAGRLEGRIEHMAYPHSES